MRHFVVNGYRGKGVGTRFEAREYATELEALARRDRMLAELHHDAGAILESVEYFCGSRRALDKTYERVKVS